MSNKSHRLPNGDTTKDVDEYLKEWRKISSVLEEVLDAQVYGFDPDFGICKKDASASFSLPLWAAKKIVELHETNRRLVTSAGYFYALSGATCGGHTTKSTENTK